MFLGWLKAIYYCMKGFAAPTYPLSCKDFLNYSSKQDSDGSISFLLPA